MKQWYLHNRKNLRIALMVGLIATIILQTTVLAQQCYGIRDNILRLHILANSDSPADQQLKYKVRDALITQGGELLVGAQNKEQAIALTQSQLDTLQQIATTTLRQNGSDQTVTVSVADTYFETRRYDTVTLPAGTYTALRVVLGEGAGKNWWCVMFPNLCIPTATEMTDDSQALRQVLTDGQTQLVEQEQPYTIKFKAVEVFQSALHQCKEWF